MRQANLGRGGKQQQEQISPNHVRVRAIVLKVKIHELKKAVELGASLVEMSRGEADEGSILELLRKCEC